MITNGYLLDEEKSKYFSLHPLNFVQITIDGDKNTHNQRRKLKNGDGTYDKILSNIDMFFEHNNNTNVVIRVNIDTSNVSSYFNLYKELTKRWEGKRLNIYPAFISNYSEGCSNRCSVLNREDQVRFSIDLFDKHQLSINIYPALSIGGCGATNINYYVVGPEGELYKCWNDIGIKDRIIGFLNNNVILNQEVLCQYLVGPTMFDDKECISCGLFPICNGGCQWLRLKNVNEGKKYDLCTIKKNNLDKFLDIHYKMQKSKKTP
jgi:uncharacterized protein